METIGECIQRVNDMLDKARYRVQEMTEETDVQDMPDVLIRILADIQSDIQGSYYHNGSDGLYALITRVAYDMGERV